MTETQRVPRSAEPPREDIDDLIFLGQTEAQVSQR